MKKKIKKVFIAVAVFGLLNLGFSSAGAAGISLPSVGLPSGSLSSIIQGLVKWLLGIFGFLAIISFVISGMMYFLAMGDDKEMEKAKKQMQWSIIGVIVGLMGYIVITAINKMLGGGGLG